MDLTSNQSVTVGSTYFTVPANRSYFLSSLKQRFTKSTVIKNEVIHPGIYWLDIPFTLAEQYWKKTCSSCAHEKVLGDFYRSDTKAEPLPRWNASCRERKRNTRNLKYKETARAECSNVFTQNKNKENAASTNKASRALKPAQYERTFSYIDPQKHSQQKVRGFVGLQHVLTCLKIKVTLERGCI